MLNTCLETKMTNRSYAFAIISTLFVGCGSTADSPDLDPLDPIDSTFVDGRADSNAVVRPGTAEADAVLRFANQPLPDAAAADDFLVMLDQRLHRTAAERLVEARAGDDGQFGTADDAAFASLADLDRVPYIGRVALMRLYDLAEEAGYMSLGSDCSLVIGGSRIDSLAALVEIENSRCDHFAGDLEIALSDTMLPAYRSLKSLDYVQTVEGKLTITNGAALVAAVFRGLDHVGEIHSDELSDTPAQFPALRRANQITLIGDHSVALPALRWVSRLHIESNHVVVADFPSLIDAEVISVDAEAIFGFRELRNASELRIRAVSTVEGFDELRRADLLHVLGLDGFTAIDISAFGKLERVKSSLRLDGGAGRLQTSFASLTEVGDLYFTYPDADFPRLRTAGAMEFVAQDADALLERSFPELKTATSVRFDRARQFPFPSLQFVDGDFRLRADHGPLPSRLESVGGEFETNHLASSYAHLTHIGGRAALDCVDGHWNVLSAVRDVGSLELNSRNCQVSGLDLLSAVEGDVWIEATAGGAIWVLPLLTRTGDLGFRVGPDVAGAEHLLPTVERVAGDLYAFGPDAHTPGPITGVNALDGVDGAVFLNDANQVDGLRALRSVGGSVIEIDRDIPLAERDRFLGQLVQFSGQIREI
jgi:hypothetical protein